MVRNLLCGSLLVVLAGLSGCGLGSGPSSNPLAASKPASAKATGSVYGGQQPVTGSTIQLWQVGTTGFGSSGSSLIPTTVTTSDGTGLLNSNANAGNANNSLPAGQFTLNFTNAYSCPTPGTLVYMTSTGGNPGLTSGTNNSAIVMMTALGQCGNLNSSTFISLNEVVTTGTVENLSTFLSASGSIGSPSDAASLQAIANAFAAVASMVNTSTGAALSGFPKLNTLANAMVPCINSTLPTSSSCVSLFTDATPSGGSAPSTVLGALLDVTLNPTLNGTAIYNLSTPNAPFQPALTSAPGLWNITTASAATSACGTAGGGDDVSGTIAYSGSKTGRIYIAINNTNGCDTGTQGISIAGPGTFTIHGVPPGPAGTYYLQAFMDTQGDGANNAADPSGSNASFAVSVPNFTAPTLTLADPATVTLTSAPTLNVVSASNTSVLAQFKPINSNNVEQATSYTLQWSTTSGFTAVAGSQTFPAVGGNQNIWIVNAVNHPELSNGSVFYFRAYGTSAGTAASPNSAVFGPVTIGAPTAGSAVSGAITFSGAATGPLYTGFYNQDSSTAIPVIQYIGSPVSMQAYSVDVPNSPSAVYIPVAIIDQNNNGVVDPGDITNITFQGGPIAVTGALANQNLTLPSGNAVANLPTQHFQSGSGQSYGLYFSIGWGRKLPVTATLLNSYNSDGANFDGGPMDIASCAVPPNSCSSGETGFQIFLNLGATAPATGDTYPVKVTYSDGSFETLVLEVTNVLSTFATGLAPQTGGSTSTTPTFTWTDPTCGACNTYTYTFYMNDSSGNTVWEVPGQGNGLPPGTNSLAWPTDPTKPANTPSIGSLSTSTTYSWSVTVQDSNYNQAIQTVSYQP